MIIACPHCKTRLSVDLTPQMGGKQVRCPKCQRPFVLPYVGALAVPAQGAVGPQAGGSAPRAERAAAAVPPPPPTPAAAQAEVPPPPPAPPRGGAGRSRLAQRRARAALVDSPLKKVAAAGFAAALLCFLLPFFHVSCMGTTVMTVSGIALVTGGKAQLSGEIQSMAKQGAAMAASPISRGLSEAESKVDVEALAVMAAAATALGLLLSFVPRKAGVVGGMGAGAAAILLLVALMFKLDGDLKRDITKQKGATAQAVPSVKGMPTGFEGMEEAMKASVEKSLEGMIELKAAVGFWLAVLCLAAAGVLHLVAMVQMSRLPAPT